MSVEFGEKIKQLREEKGMTQQTMSEKLYVTRQAVSRWECGARYPDLITTKKIAQILEVTIDELVSGEELKKDIEKEPVMAQPVANVVQTLLYSIAMTAYLVMSVISFLSYIPLETNGTVWSTQVSLTGIATTAGYVLNLVAAVIGLVLSLKGKLTAKMTGIIMSVPYFFAVVNFIVSYVDMQIKDNGVMDFAGWIEFFIIPLTIGVCIAIFFVTKTRRIPYIFIFLVCLITAVYYVYSGIVMRLMYFSETQYIVQGVVHCLGGAGMALLLGYQALVLDKKKKIAYK